MDYLAITEPEKGGARRASLMSSLKALWHESREEDGGMRKKSQREDRAQTVSGSESR